MLKKKNLLKFQYLARSRLVRTNFLPVYKTSNSINNTTKCKFYLKVNNKYNKATSQAKPNGCFNINNFCLQITNKEKYCKMAYAHKRIFSRYTFIKILNES